MTVVVVEGVQAEMLLEKFAAEAVMCWQSGLGFADW